MWWVDSELFWIFDEIVGISNLSGSDCITPWMFLKGRWIFVLQMEDNFFFVNRRQLNKIVNGRWLIGRRPMFCWMGDFDFAQWKWLWLSPEFSFNGQSSLYQS